MINVAVKEFTELLYNPKFLLTFAVSTVLILLGLFNGYSVYVTEKSLADQGTAIASELSTDQNMRFCNSPLDRFNGKKFSG